MSASTTSGGDVLRSGAAVVLATAVPLSTQLARWTGRGTPEVEQATASEGPVTPAAGAFVIWAPLFAGNLIYAVSDLKGVRNGGGVSPGAGWLANAALAGNIAWSVNSQFRRLDEASVALIGGSLATSAAAVALAERRRDRPENRTLARCIGALAGWLSVATFANVETTLNLRRGHPDDEAATRRAAALVGVASVAASAICIGLRGNPAFALAAGWGLGGVALKARRRGQWPVASAATAGLVAVAAGSIGRRSSAVRGSVDVERTGDEPSAGLSASRAPGRRA